MKKLIIFVTLISGLEAMAQFTVAPFGSAGPSSPPVGSNRKSACANGRCSLEVNIRPYCFGTNLRAYSEDKQLKPKDNVVMDFVLTGTGGSQDKFQIEFPSTITYASDGVRTDCLFKDPYTTDPGDKTVVCAVPGAQTYEYRVSRWKVDGDGWTDFIKYGGRQLDASLISGSNIDQNIKCLYKFETNNRDGALIQNKVSCYFPSKLPDLSNQIIVRKEGNEVKGIAVEAGLNRIKLVLEEPLNTVPKTLPVKHGRVISSTPPAHSVSYTQGGNLLAANKESETFDEQNANRTFTTIVKFPGSEGYCGGFYSPLMFFFDKDLPQFNGVSTFPLYGSKPFGRVNWPEADSKGHFLARLKAGEGKVTSATQLFGQSAEHNNGFDALKVHDHNQDNVIDSKDVVWNELKLWNDKNGNGETEKGELTTLAKRGIASINLNYSSRDVTKFGQRARVREKSTFTYESKGKKMKADVFDVWLAPID